MEGCVFITLEDLASFTTVERWQEMYGASEGVALAAEGEKKLKATATAGVTPHSNTQTSIDSYEYACSPPRGRSFSPLSHMLTLEVKNGAGDLQADIAEESPLEVGTVLDTLVMNGRDGSRNLKEADIADESRTLEVGDVPEPLADDAEEDIFELEL